MTIAVYEVTHRRALVSRSVAVDIASHVASVVGSDEGDSSLTLDFNGVEAVGPSFLDELLGRISELTQNEVRTITFKSAPSRLSEKFKAVARGREASIAQVGDSDWVVQLPAVV